MLSEAVVRALGPLDRLVGVDLSPRLLERAVARLRERGVEPCLARADVRHLPFRDATMDLVTCGLVLDHLGERSKALAEWPAWPARARQWWWLRPGRSLRTCPSAWSSATRGCGPRPSSEP